MSNAVLNHDAYTVGWAATLPCEVDAARLVLDEEHDESSTGTHDPNSYLLGRMGVHNVVIAYPPLGRSGIASAARVVTNMTQSFRNIRFVLLVGIGGGAPGAPDARNPLLDLRLGDVVVCCPDGSEGGIVHHDHGKFADDGFRAVTHVSKPPSWLLTRVNKLRSEHNFERGLMAQYIRDVQLRIAELGAFAEYQFPGRELDMLFHCDSAHKDADNCALCDKGALMNRRDREKPTVHYGLIASGSQVMRSAKRRDELRAQKNILCFEMEAAGLMDDFSCLVIRGISNYADSHKNDLWQGYAAVTAAAYAKDLLRIVKKVDVDRTETVTAVLDRYKMLASTYCNGDFKIVTKNDTNGQRRG